MERSGPFKDLRPEGAPFREHYLSDTVVFIEKRDYESERPNDSTFSLLILDPFEKIFDLGPLPIHNVQLEAEGVRMTNRNFERAELGHFFLICWIIGKERSDISDRLEKSSEAIFDLIDPFREYGTKKLQMPNEIDLILVLATCNALVLEIAYRLITRSYFDEDDFHDLLDDKFS